MTTQMIITAQSQTVLLSTHAITITLHTNSKK